MPNTKKTTSAKKKKKKGLKSIVPEGVQLVSRDVIDRQIKNLGLAGKGRPTKYNKAMCKRAVELMAQGLSKMQVALRLGVSNVTLYNWITELDEDGNPNPMFKPDFFNAIKIGEDFCQDWWMLAGQFNLANKDFNVGLYAIQMANRFGWSRVDKVIEVNQKSSHTEKKVLEVNLNYSQKETKELIGGLIDDGVIELDS